MQLNFLFDKISHLISYNRQKIERLVDFIKLMLFILLTTHVLACAWISVGMRTEDHWVAA